MKRFRIATLLLLACLSLKQPAYSCSWAKGYFHQVTNLHGTVVGMNRGWPRWVRQRVARADVRMRLYQYDGLRHEPSRLPPLKEVTTDSNGRFDFGQVREGHYTLIIDWPREASNWFDVEIKRLPKETSSIKIDVTPVFPDCKGGHEFIVQ